MKYAIERQPRGYVFLDPLSLYFVKPSLRLARIRAPVSLSRSLSHSTKTKIKTSSPLRRNHSQKSSKFDFAQSPSTSELDRWCFIEIEIAQQVIGSAACLQRYAHISPCIKVPKSLCTNPYPSYLMRNSLKYNKRLKATLVASFSAPLVANRHCHHIVHSLQPC